MILSWGIHPSLLLPMSRLSAAYTQPRRHKGPGFQKPLWFKTKLGNRA